MSLLQSNEMVLMVKFQLLLLNMPKLLESLLRKTLPSNWASSMPLKKVPLLRSLKFAVTPHSSSSKMERPWNTEVEGKFISLINIQCNVQFCSLNYGIDLSVKPLTHNFNPELPTPLSLGLKRRLDLLPRHSPL